MMALKDYEDGDVLSQSQIDANTGAGFTISALNHIRHLMAGTTTFSSDQKDGWAELYSLPAGLLDSVSAISSTGGWGAVTNNMLVADFSAAASNSAALSNSGSSAAEAFISVTNTSSVPKKLTQVSYYLSANCDGGIEFIDDGTTSGNVIYEQSFSSGGAGGTSGIETLDVSSANICLMPSEKITMRVWNSSTGRINTAGTASTGAANDVTLSATSGTSAHLGYGVGTVYPFTFITATAATAATAAEITHTIPSGTFASDISSSVGVAFFDDWESGSSVQYKLSNASDDSGWLTSNAVSEFTAFSSEPTTLTVKIIPKSSSPTTAVPSIKGFWVVAR
jgi:hypothetical protein